MTREGQYVSEEKADKRVKKATALFNADNEQKLVDFVRDNDILYNKRLQDCKDRSKREAVWDKFCEENNLEKDACQKWFQSQHTLFRKVNHMKSVLGDNFDFLMDHIVCHLKGKSEFRAPKGSASRRETVHMEPFQDTSHPESTYDPSDMSHLDTHMPTPRSCGISMTSSLADSDL